MYMDNDDILTYESAFIDEDKLPINYDKYSLKVAPPAFINKLGGKITYLKPTGEQAYFNPNTLEIQISKASGITGKQSEIHELGHAMYETRIVNDIDMIQKLKDIIDNASEAYGNNKNIIEFVKQLGTS
jgi:hypothetical protein